MKITVESTTQIVDVNGIPAHVWEGQTESGIKVYCFITRILVPRGEDESEFERELQECRPPSVTFPLSLIL